MRSSFTTISSVIKESQNMIDRLWTLPGYWVIHLAPDRFCWHFFWKAEINFHFTKGHILQHPFSQSLMYCGQVSCHPFAGSRVTNGTNDELKQLKQEVEQTYFAHLRTMTAMTLKLVTAAVVPLVLCTGNGVRFESDRSVPCQCGCETANCWCCCCCLWFKIRRFFSL